MTDIFILKSNKDDGSDVLMKVFNDLDAALGCVREMTKISGKETFRNQALFIDQYSLNDDNEYVYQYTLFNSEKWRR